MDFTEEHIARSLVNVSEERRAEVLETFRELERRNELLNQQRLVLNQEIDSFRTDLASMGVRRVVPRSSFDKHMLNPALWSTLPLEILQLVFAHLPLIDIIGLRVLSKTWDRYVIGDIPGFTKVCAEVNPKLLGMVGVGGSLEDEGMMSVILHDSKTWYRFNFPPQMEGQMDTMHAGDGGLVCIVSLAKCSRQHPRIVVYNPLTSVERELPKVPHALRSVQPSMVQVVMDRDSKCYKVFVVCPKKGRGRAVVASVYSSMTEQWRSAEASDGLVFGYHHDWHEGYDSDDDFLYSSSRIPCVYNCAEGKLVDLDDGSSPWKAAVDQTRIITRENSTFTLVKDRLFVLHMEPHTNRVLGYVCDRYYISEYQAQTSRPHWVKLRDHRCSEFEYPPSQDYYMHLYACNDFLLVTANNGAGIGFQHDLAWVLELCSGEWQAISGLDIEDTEESDMAMFELQWDALP